ncbi:MAG: 2,3-bisphosphoglycerate-independent phosphoglycerate mutase [Geminicoccaceae bacterium]|nr:2,3-bisphosphoglycerate-independent phosphoglycerate mutase [Geminicoccaceae bacterium]
MLVVLDGWGYREERTDNAVALAHTPCFDRLWEAGPRCLLRTDGREVGLPDGQFGNSEVGHLNLGAGRIVMQDLPRIDAAIADGSLARNEVLAKLIEAVRRSGGRVHLLGLASPGGVHSHQRHIVALARTIAEHGPAVDLHLFLDGRDTPPSSAEAYLAELERELATAANIRFATIGGRYWAMDRDRRWERTARALAAIVDGAAPRAVTWREALESAYALGQTDEFVEPRVLGSYQGIADGDGLLCANFRADRVRQILMALLVPDLPELRGRRLVRFSAAVGMTRYSEELDRYLSTLFGPQPMDHLLGEVLAEAGMRQLRMAETEKYPHVTFFFNGGEERLYPGEERILVPSPKVATYDLQPEMSARELTDRYVDAVRSRDFDFVLINFANPDMVGHTGNLEAAIKAVEVVDECLSRVVATTCARHGALIVTADHGNCELMRDPITGQPHTAHTANPVPCVLVGGPPDARLRGGRLADVAPTILALLGLPQPAAMTGRSLLLP